MILWFPSTNEYNKVKNHFVAKVCISCFSPCPHSSSRIALGLKSGLVVLVDIKKNGVLLFKLRGHLSDVVSLSWCPAPVNVFPSMPNNYLKGTVKLCHGQQSHLEATEEIESETQQRNIEARGETERENLQAEVQARAETEREIRPIVGDAAAGIATQQRGESIEHTHMNTWNDRSLESKNHVENIFKPFSFSMGSSMGSSILARGSQYYKNYGCELVVGRLCPGSDSDSERESQESIEFKESNKTEIAKKIIDRKHAIDDSQSSISGMSSNQASSSEMPEASYQIPRNEASSEELIVSAEIHSEEAKSEDVKPDESSDTASSRDISITEAEHSSPGETISATSLEEDPRHEYLLASSGKDGTIYIWRAKTDGRMQCSFRIPEKRYSYQNRNKKVKEASWTLVKWVTPSTLLTATKKGELLKYTVPKRRGSQKEYTIVHNEHSSLIFSIGAYVHKLSYENWLCESTPKIWTFGHDMFLLNTHLTSETIHTSSIETFCALVTCMAQSPLDPSRICMGLSNGTIKIWNANNSNAKNFSTVNYSPKIFSKITCVAWHPTNELLVAFSTEEGTIGIINTNNSHKATWFKQSFSNKVHKIQWGPHKNNKDKIGLYATGGGDLLCFNPEETNSEPLKIELSGVPMIYTFSWKLDNSLMLVVENSGKMLVAMPDFSIKVTYYATKKLSSLVWHPDSQCDSGEISPKSYWAAAAIDNTVFIFDFAEVSDKQGTLNTSSVTKAVFEEHQGPIRSLAWSPFHSNRLVTAGEDGLAHVWDVENQQILASYYSQNFEPIKSIIWSPINEDLLICSMTNASLFVWKMSDYPAPLNEDILAKCKLHMKNEKRISSPKEDDSIAKTTKKIKKSTKNIILPPLNPGTVDSPSEKVKILRELLHRKVGGTSSDVPDVTQLFGTKKDVLELLAYSESSHVAKDRQEASSMVSLWKGDLKSNIQEAIVQRKLTPFLISLAPTISPSMWKKTCEAYALQLEHKSDSDPLEIAAYYIACQNVQKAIECLCEREMFKEALVLAKCRLPADNLFEEDILHQWATFSTYCGSLETAAQCYIVLEKYEEAVRVLFRRNDSCILSFALELAKLVNNEELIKAVEFRIEAFAENGERKISSSDKNDVLVNENEASQDEGESTQENGKENEQEGEEE
ncbi:hypothetical protein HHI36_011091 [Cryptolaemus montrouzieri]|uniref:Gem-associated protein 5 n=1 Tax=Cryptolaemus montrouzieri TaxID=559131 RepID=A0ABD2MKM1_9CUCU